MVLVVSHRPVIVEAWVQSQGSPGGIWVNKVALEQGRHQVLQFSPISVIPPLFHTHISFICH